MQDKIVVKGAREHNLKNVNLTIPRNKMVVFTGLSGSGKSSLAYDTIFAEGQRRYIESLSAYARQFLGKLDKPDVDEIEGLSPAISIDQKAHSANPRSTVATITEIYDYLRVLYARAGKPYCPDCGHEIRKMTTSEIVDAIIDLYQESNDGGNLIILAPAVRGRKGEYYQMLYDFLNAGFSEARIDGELHSLRDRVNLDRYKAHTIEIIIDRIPGGLNFVDKENRLRLSEAVESALKYGNDVVTAILGGIKSGSEGKEISLSAKFTCPRDGFSFPEIEPRLFSFNSPYGACPECHGIGEVSLQWEHEAVEGWQRVGQICSKCDGKRLKKESLSVLVDNKNIATATQYSISDAYEFFDTLHEKLSPKEREVADVPLREIKSRLKFMIDVGLEYLTLNRKAGTLSGGESQRIRLASQIGSRLVGALYVLDEPTIGLHQRDNKKLIKTLHELRDLGNSIIVVEHDEETIKSSDYLVDFGPGAGVHGGKIIAQGDLPEILSSKGGSASGGKDKKQDSLTLRYLRGEEFIPVPKKRRKVNSDIPHLKIRGAKENNLKDINVEIPVGRFTAITGVSGSGKSTLIYDVLHKFLANKFNRSNYKVGAHKSIIGAEYFNRIINIDQSPIGRTPRSNPATYIGAWSHIRDLFTATEGARVRGWKPGRFSFNVKGGRCENCEGHGYIGIEMHFLPTVYVTCDICHGKRFDRETLEVTYAPSGKKADKKNIHDVLKMTIEEARDFFKDIPWLNDKLSVIDEVGLGYLGLGQSATTLSGGEAQRVKLAAELGKRDTRQTIYLLDEPTTGLHFADVHKLLEVLNRLVERGNTVVVIEHNLDVIKTADWVIDLGPEGGEKGGEVVAFGTPEVIARSPKSATAEYIRKVLK